MRKLVLLGLLVCLSSQFTPQHAQAQAAAPAGKKPAKAAPAEAPPPAPAPQAAPAPAPAPVAPAAPPGAFPQQEAQAAPPPMAPPPAPPIAAGAYPYGYGYGYQQAPADPARQKTLAELQALDLRLVNLRAQQKQYSITGPATMMGAGFAVMLGFGIAAIFERIVAEDIQHGDCHNYYDDDYYYHDPSYCDVNNNGFVTQHDEDLARTMARSFGAVSAIGGAVGITGAVFFFKRLQQRKQFAPEMEELKVKRGQLLQQLRYGTGYSSNGFSLTLSGRF